jgi:hypothetical protein
MGKRLTLILLLAATLFGLGVSSSYAANPTDPGPRWESLSPEIKQVLAPVASDWESMPGFQRKRLVNAAKHYPKLSLEEQARFREQLPRWAKLPHEERKDARETYKKYHSLPQEQRDQLKKRWQEENGASPQTSPASAAVPMSPSGTTDH